MEERVRARQATGMAVARAPPIKVGTWSFPKPAPALLPGDDQELPVGPEGKVLELLPLRHILFAPPLQGDGAKMAVAVVQEPCSVDGRRPEKREEFVVSGLSGSVAIEEDGTYIGPS